MRLLGLLLTFAVVAVAFGDGDDDNDGRGVTPSPGSGTDPSVPPDVTTEFTVRTSVVTLTDATRPTPATANAEGRAHRRLVTHLYEPVGDGPFPLVVFAHGLDGHPRKFSQLHTAWAEAGYVIVAPTFPLSNDGAPGGADFVDLVEQPGDLAFVLDEVLGSDSPLGIEVDPDRIGAGGLSLGGATVYGLVYDDCCRDGRVTAAMVLDGNELDFDPDLTSGPPLMLAHSDPDPALPYDNAVGHFDSATVPVGFLTLEGPAHAEPFEDVDHPTDAVAEAVTIAWWDHWLAPGGPATEDRGVGALDRIATAVAEAGALAVWQARLD